MKPADYYRDLAARLRAVDGKGNDLREDAAAALYNAADIIVKRPTVKGTRTYQRAVEEANAALLRAKWTTSDLASISLAIGFLSDLAAKLPALDKQAKARRERIEWIHVADGVHVTRVGRDTYRLMEDGDSLSLQIDNGGVGCVSFEEITTVAGKGGAARAIRAWRKHK